MFSIFRTGDVAQESLTLPRSEFGDPMVLASRGWSPKPKLEVDSILTRGPYIEAISDMEA